MENNLVNLYYYRVVVSIDNEISIEKKEYKAILNGRNYTLCGEIDETYKFVQKSDLDQMQRYSYSFYSLRNDYTDEEILDKFTPYIQEELEYHAGFVRDFEKQLFNCLYYDKEKENND